MKAQIKRLAVAICVFLMAVPVLFRWQCDEVLAEQAANISISSGSCYVGQEISVTINITSDEVMLLCNIFLQYDSGKLEAVSGFTGGGGGKVNLYKELQEKSASFTVKFKALETGRHTVSVVTESNASHIGGEVTDRMELKVSSGTVSVSTPITYSSDNKLSSLTISPGTLSPAFSPDVTSYTASIGEHESRITVSAKPNDSKAKVAVSGNENLKAGSNTVAIMVTAENGNRRRYEIVVSKPEPPQTTPAPVVKKKASVNGIEYEIDEDYSVHSLPAGYAPMECSYNDGTVLAGKGANNGIYIMYLETADTNGRNGFYIYDTTNKNFIPYVMLNGGQLSYVVLPITGNMERPEGYRAATVNMNDITVEVLKSGNEDFCLFYGVNSLGNTGWYSYDAKEGTVQRYVGFGKTNQGETQGGANVSTDGKNGQTGAGNVQTWKLAAFIMAAAVVILAALTAVFIAKNKKLVAAYAKVEDGMEETDAEQAGPDEVSLEEIDADEEQKAEKDGAVKESGESRLEEDISDTDVLDVDILAEGMDAEEADSEELTEEIAEEILTDEAQKDMQTKPEEGSSDLKASDFDVDVLDISEIDTPPQEEESQLELTEVSEEKDINSMNNSSIEVIEFDDLHQ